MADTALTSATQGVADEEERQRLRARRIQSIATWALPVVVMAIVLGYWQLRTSCSWQGLCTAMGWEPVPHFILPSPQRIGAALIEDWASLTDSWMITLSVTAMALGLAVTVGVGLAILFNLSKWVEMSFFPYAVVLQVTPIVSIAPLIFIYVENKLVGLLICAWIVAFFPILSNTTLGLSSADHNLRDLFKVYGANRWQRLRYLQIPSALPYFLGGLKIAGGLSLIGAVVAEFVAGSGGIGSGLAYRILEAGYRLNIPRMFAALFLIVITGIAIFAITSLLSHLLLRKWHESAVKRET